ncbi:hypothetical protein RV134_190014 [Roseovarius sp. EC-HK134]|nr:hypothetical protein RV134_190014 [Roseovarius sp. EC-HK134]VVT00028.1 hypothetical protein RV420_230010 [Roseovarius sp. EC-SD190]
MQVGSAEGRSLARGGFPNLS